MTSSVFTLSATQDSGISQKTTELFHEQQSRIFHRTDRLFFWLMLIQWIFGIAAAFWISPLTWAGAHSETHLHVWSAIVLGGIITIFPTCFVLTIPGTILTRHVIAISQMLTSALLIHLSGGRIESHFHIFGSLAFLATYRDWRVLVTATIVVTVDHFFRGVFYPNSVFGILTASPWRVFEHAGWVVFEDLFLLITINQSLKEMKEAAWHQSWLINANQIVEAEIAYRTQELEVQTKELRKSRQLTESLSAFGDILENSHNEIFIFNAATLSFVHVNRGAQKNIGYTTEELRRLTPLDLQPERSQASFNKMIGLLLEGTQESTEFTAVFRRKNGSEYPVEVCLETSTLYGDDVFVAVVLDITERQRTEMELLDSRERAIAADRTKSEFLANMSHEIRTPMTAIMGYADLLLEEVNADTTPEQRIKDVQIIKRNGEHLLGIIDDILDLSKIDAGKMNVESLPCSPLAIVEEVLSLMRVRSEAKGIALDVTYETFMPVKFQSDPTRLRQILVNLVGNSIKFTEIGGVRLVVRLVNGNDPRLEFDVVDTGVGMSKDHQERIFRPFTQADTTMTRKFGGTGLGLTICKRLAVMLGGDVFVVETDVGKGSRFRAVIATGPLDNVQMIDPTANEVEEDSNIRLVKTHEPACSLAGSRILLAEDGPDNQQLIAFVIKKAGADVTVVENGQFAVDVALQALAVGQPFHVILMDMQMPVLNGYGAVALLRARNYGGAIIALTAHSMSGDREKCIAAGCDDYATKPINKAALISTCQRWIEQTQEESSPIDNTPMPETLDANAQSTSTAILVSDLAEDPDMAPLVHGFVSKLNPKVTAMTEYLSTNRLDELAKLAHQLKGAGGGYGFPTISDAAWRVEQQATSDTDLEQIQRSVAELTSLCQQAIAGSTHRAIP